MGFNFCPVQTSKFVRTDACDWAFNTLKHRLTSELILVTPHDKGTFVLATDAPGTALGPSHSNSKMEHCKLQYGTNYASCALSDAEIHYRITCGELLEVA